MFGWLEKKHWFLVSDVSGLVKGMTSNLSWLTVIAVLLVPFSAYLLWHTTFGLRLRSVGEAPTAADSLGVPVYRMKYIGVLISGALSGLAGRVPRARERGSLQGGPDRRARLHRPRRADLRQLDASRHRDGCRALRLRGRAPAAQQ